MLTGRSDRIGLANRSGGLVPDKRARWPLEFPMTASDILAFVRTHSLAVQASVSMLGNPQAAVVGFIATDDFEMFFDTADSTRKVQNLRHNSHCALVIGGMTSGDERTVQYEGIADEPRGMVCERLKEVYFERFPEGRDRQHWPGLTYIRVRPRWLRFSDFNQSPPTILELTF
jgi:general stress protein 26